MSGEHQAVDPETVERTTEQEEQSQGLQPGEEHVINVDFVIAAPDKDEPGFLKRMKKALRFQRQLEDNEMTPAIVDEMVTFLLDYVKVPADRAKAEEVIWSASEAEFNEMLDAVSGGEAEPDPQNGGVSETS